MPSASSFTVLYGLVLETWMPGGSSFMRASGV